MNQQVLFRLLKQFGEYLPLIIFLVLTPLMLYLSYRQRRKQMEKLKVLATKLGFHFKGSDLSGEIQQDFSQRIASYGGQRQIKAEKAYRQLGSSDFLRKLSFLAQPLAIAGSYDGFPVEIRLLSQNKKNYTETTVFFPEPLNLGLKISKAGFWNKSLNLVKSSRLDTGNADLDKAVVISARDEARAKYFAKNFDSQQALLSLFKHRGAELDDRGAIVRQDGYQTDYVNIKTILDDATRALRAILHALGRD